MSFDALARHYSWMETVLAGSKLQRCRTAFLDRVEPPDRVLLAGEGTGRFLGECRRIFPQAQITMVDASTRMLAQARRTLARHPVGLDGVEFVQADLREWSGAPAEFDLLVTHFFLDCFPPDQLAIVVKNLARATSTKASWLLADFQVPARGWSRLRAEAIHALMYAFFRTFAGLAARRVTPPDAMLRAHGFELRERQICEWGLLHSDFWSHAPALPPPC